MRPSNLVIVVVLVGLFAFRLPALAAIAVSPARVEVEVLQGGADRQLFFANRGDSPVVLNLYVGLGFPDELGAVNYDDRPDARQQADLLIDVYPEVLVIPPGGVGRATLRFSDVPGMVAAYPVIFAEVEPEAPTGEFSPPRASRLRVAVPALVTFAATRDQRTVVPSIQAVTARIDPIQDSLVADVLVHNAGTTHGMISADVYLVDSLGARIGVQESRTPQVDRELRVLPGATRRYTVRWPLSAIPRDIRIVAEVSSGERSTLPALVAVALPTEWAWNDAGIAVRSLAARPVGVSGLSITGFWQNPSASKEFVADIVLYDAEGRELERTRFQGDVTAEPGGGMGFEHVLSLSPERLAQVFGVGLELSAGGQGRGYAVTTLAPRPLDESRVSLSAP